MSYNPNWPQQQQQPYEVPFFESSFSETEGYQQGIPEYQYAPTYQPYEQRKVYIFSGSFEDEPPLLEELGINFSHIWGKTSTVLNIFKKIDPRIMDDTDLAGPIVFCLLLGFFLLLNGKVHFGYIYGVGVIGCLSIYLVLNLMSENGIDIYRTISVLGYCLLPMIFLAGISIILPLNGYLGFFLAMMIVLWCTHSAAYMFVAVLSMREQTILVFYPTGLVYTCFALITIF
eukprot:TRINITY_DN15664_c0_g1_i1.p1 TRINITY_DN15664_c0_g1~~TRINITY_DN15664_c0_g1_i1.p1  ORF type:complete len:252 (-),score=9.54 TRINITY_DN15664_c0_g1_i1:150-839(-)